MVMGNIKRILLVYCVMNVAWSSVIYSHDGTVNISGSFKDNACVLALDDKNIAVQFDDISASRFSHIGDSSPAVTFTIHLQECGADVTNVNVAFSGTPDATNTQLLSIDPGNDSASGLGVAILDYTQTLIPIKNASVNYPLIPGDVPLVFYAQLRATADKVDAGSIHASATFTFHYE